MSPVLRYTLARLGLFAVAAAVLLALPIGLDWLLRLAIAVLISAAASYLLLRGMRDQVAVQVAGVAERRAERRRRLHAALAGEDHPEPTDAERTGDPDLPG
jgi:hypothetical protein